MVSKEELSHLKIEIELHRKGFLYFILKKLRLVGWIRLDESDWEKIIVGLAHKGYEVRKVNT